MASHLRMLFIVLYVCLMCQEPVSGPCCLSVLQVLLVHGWHNTSVLFLFYTCVLCVRSLCQANAACQFYKFYSSMDGKPPQCFFFETCGRTVSHRPRTLVTSRVISKYHESLRVWLHFYIKNKKQKQIFYRCFSASFVCVTSSSLCWILCQISGWYLAHWLERLTVNAKVATVLGSILASSGTVESEGRQKKQCWINKVQKIP